MSWLSEDEIRRFIKRNADKATSAAFQGVFPMSKLPHAVNAYPFFMIVNTQSHNLPGEHWITIFIGSNRRGEIFDSLALPLSNRLVKWMNTFCISFTKNSLAYQHPLSARCGVYALYFVLNRLQDPNCMSLRFTKSLNDNEERVMKFYRKLK